ncbi:MAG: AAA family ATPase, partial [bacterium]
MKHAPKVVSTKNNAAKFIFRVPEEQRSKVKGISGKVTGAGYEVLWGMQGVIAGEYPGSSDGKAPKGFYALQGDLQDVPEAPEWLLAEMRAAKDADAPVQGLIKNRKGLDFSGRTEDVLFELIQDCLSVLPHLGRGTEDYWWSIGAMVAEALPNEKGLMLWSAWSCEDPAFEEEWASGNPCEAKWPHILKRAGRTGNKGVGSLIYLADQYDVERQRFRESSRKTLEEVESSKIQRIQAVHLDYEEVIKRAKALQELDNPAEMAHKMNVLALEAGYRDAGALERLLISQMQYEQQDDEMALDTFLDKDLKFEYLIPDLLPCPGTVMIHGAGGDGKSMSAWTIAKHVARGIPFSVRGDLVPVQSGPVLILNGDQSEVQVQQQMRDLEFQRTDPVTVVMGWDLNWYYRFTKLIQKHRPKLVIIDSITGCSRGSAFDENKKEFAGPIYWLSNNNGRLFPACTILLVHHANKTGGFRGSTAIRDAVDEVWGLRRPDKKQIEEVGSNARIITVETSRAGRGDSTLLMKLESDLTFSLTDFVSEQPDSGPASVVDRVLQRLRAAYPRALSRSELAADALCGGSVAAIRKATQRLISRGLVQVAEERPNESGGTPIPAFQAITSCEKPQKQCPTAKETSGGLESTVGQPKNVSTTPLTGAPEAR